jgi:hypothetical protein
MKSASKAAACAGPNATKESPRVVHQQARRVGHEPARIVLEPGLSLLLRGFAEQALLGRGNREDQEDRERDQEPGATDLPADPRERLGRVRGLEDGPSDRAPHRRTRTTQSWAFLPFT